MALDMYFIGKKYVQDWKHNYPDKTIPELTIAKITRDLLQVPFEVTDIVVSIGIWRKANQIHNWFVANVQGGDDDCKQYRVSVEQMQELIDICKRVLADNSLIERLLPPINGVYFGNFDDLTDTIAIMEKALACPELEYYYYSSW